MSKTPIRIDLSKLDKDKTGWLHENYRILNYKEDAVKPHKLLEDSPVVHLGIKYAPFLEKYIDSMMKGWEDPTKINVSDTANGEPLRIYYTGPELNDIQAFFEKEFGDKISTIAAVRNGKTTVNRGQDLDNGEHWGPVFWHVDTFSDSSYTILIYLTDVDEKTGPFEYAYPPENYVYSKDQLLENNIDPNGGTIHPNDSVVLIGPKYTALLFSSYLLHRGNYAFEKDRSALWITFNINEEIANTSKDKVWDNAKK
jgi:hypothetical protein